MAAQKATDIRRALAEVETHARKLRERQSDIESQVVGVPAMSWLDVAAKASYVLGLYADTLDANDAHHRQFITAVLEDFARLSVRDSSDG